MPSEKVSKLRRREDADRERHKLQSELFRRWSDILGHMDPAWLDSFRLAVERAASDGGEDQEDLMHAGVLAGLARGAAVAHQSWLVDRATQDDES